MSDDLRVFRELVLWLWETHEKPWEYSHEDARLIVESAHLTDSSFTSITELNVNLPSETNVSASFGNRFFCLKPVTEHRIMVPRIHLKCDFGRNIPEVRCRLELFLLNVNAEIRSLGYRYESPEGKNIQGGGVHHYYHIQLTKPPISNVDWLPETQPAFPVDADGPVKLILSVLISLYGLNYLGTILRDANIPDLDKHIKSISCFRLEAFEWYKLVEIGVKYSEGYKVSSDVNEFETYIRGKNPGCVISGISRTKYEALRDSKKKKYP
jgi:hypothetical protein